ncbi:MAG: ABC transporter substrate-binding protein, partial [Candidatus Acidiferrales bacterium]
MREKIWERLLLGEGTKFAAGFAALGLIVMCVAGASAGAAAVRTGSATFGTTVSARQTKTPTQGDAAAIAAPAQTAATRIITDEVGRRVAVPVDVRRIVTLAPDLTETIYALGLGAKLAGDTDYCDTPPEAKLKPHVGNAQNPSLEAILALHPDL